MPMDSMQKVLLAGGALAGAGALLYCLFKDEEPGQGPVKETSGAPVAPVRNADLSENEVLAILEDIIKFQEGMRAKMSELAKELRENPMGLYDTYERLRVGQSEDPLHRRGLSAGEFDQFLNKYQNRPQIEQGIIKIMSGTTGASGKVSSKSETATKKELIEVHKTMKVELEKVADEYAKLPQKKDMDPKTVAIAAQAMVGAKVEEKHGFTSEDVEAAVMRLHQELGTDQEFVRVNMSMQQTMAKLMPMDAMQQ